MLTKEYILECLDKYCDFGSLCENTFYEQIVKPLEDNQCFSNWTYDSGVSKGVLIFQELDFVVKIPFMGNDDGGYESHFEDENGEWRYSYETNASKYIKDGKWEWKGGEYYFSDFCGAGDFEWNYCALEAKYYKDAVAAGVERCFAKTEFLGEANDHPIYIQERCSMFGAEYHSSKREMYAKRTKKDYEQVTELRHQMDFSQIDDDWMLDFLIFWGESVLKKFISFIQTQSIWDLHNGNIGYRHGVPCLVDYSSYEA